MRYAIISGIIALGIGGYFIFAQDSNFGAPIATDYPTIGWIRPINDTQWLEDVKQEQLNYRFDFQLQEMKENLEMKIVKHKEDLDDLLNCPECFRYPLQKEGIEKQRIDDRYIGQVQQKREEYERVSRSVERINKEIDLRQRKVVDRKQDILKINPSTDREREELSKL